MTKFTQSIRSKITAGVAAALVSTLFVVAAIGPVNPAAAAPTAVFRGKAADGVARGALAMKGRTHPLEVRYLRAAQADGSERVTGEATVSRSAFGLSASAGQIPDAVKIAFDFRARRQQDRSSAPS